MTIKSKAKRGAAYSEVEDKAIATAYVALAVAQYTGQKLSKAQLTRDLQASVCSERSRGSIDASFMNCSGVAVDNSMLPGLPFGYVKGYKPAPNYRKGLLPALQAALIDAAAHDSVKANLRGVAS